MLFISILISLTGLLDCIVIKSYDTSPLLRFTSNTKFVVSASSYIFGLFLAAQVYVELKEHAGYLQTFLNDQNKRLREAKQSILNIEAKEADIRNRIDRSFKVYELLDQRLQNFRNLPATNKKPLSRAEHEFKAELGM
ncbi:hypothetical protein BHM03_00015651 [Ensete ventricosum]|nr:hypothetical protein BHM03_00015651 [Ensete ventricosum]